MKLTKLELEVMNYLWDQGPSSVRELLEQFPEDGRPAYTTVQTVIYRLEKKGVVSKSKKIGNAHVFKADLSRRKAERSLVDELLRLFGGRSQPVMAHLIESGQLTLDQLKEAEDVLKRRNQGSDGE